LSIRTAFTWAEACVPAAPKRSVSRHRPVFVERNGMERDIIAFRREEGGSLRDFDLRRYRL
jgi:hypothetical protein